MTIIQIKLYNISFTSRDSLMSLLLNIYLPFPEVMTDFYHHGLVVSVLELYLTKANSMYLCVCCFPQYYVREIHPCCCEY